MYALLPEDFERKTFDSDTSIDKTLACCNAKSRLPLLLLRLAVAIDVVVLFALSFDCMC